MQHSHSNQHALRFSQAQLGRITAQEFFFLRQPGTPQGGKNIRSPLISCRSAAGFPNPPAPGGREAPWEGR